MLRRFTWLAVLLLALSVIAPAVLACESDGNCCPTEGAPCESQQVMQLACCTQPAQAMIAAAARQPEALDLPLPHGLAADSEAQPLQQPRRDCPVLEPSRSPPDQRRLYLQTARLRL